MKRAIARIAGLAFAAFAGALHAQGWPSKPINHVVPFAPGASTDILGRVIAEKLAPVLGQPMIVENKPGTPEDFQVFVKAEAIKWSDVVKKSGAKVD